MNRKFRMKGFVTEMFLYSVIGIIEWIGFISLNELIIVNKC